MIPLLVETNRALPLVSLTVALRSGARLDAPGREGSTRFMARLMRRTAAGRTSQQIDTLIDSMGASLGADVAHTTAGFHGTVITRSLEPFIDVFKDVLLRPTFASDEFGKLQRETVSELLELRDNDKALARRWFRRKLFGTHPYARSVSGTQKSVQALNDSDVRAVYASSFVRDNFVFALAGDVDEDRARRLAETMLESLPAGAPPPDLTEDPALRRGRHLVLVDKPERSQTQILIGTLGTHPRDPDHTALHVANTIFGGTFTARMTREVRSKRGWSYGAYSSLPIDRRRQAFSMWTFPKAQDAAACIQLELELLEALVKQGITKSELSWAKRYLVRSHAFALDTPSKRVGLALDETLYDLPEGYYARYTEHVQAVTLDQANAALRERLSLDDLLIVVVGTAAEIGASVRAAIGGLETVEVVPFDSDDY
jgi:zinc protease